MADHKIITISRTFGSGGRAIGEKLAKELEEKEVVLAIKTGSDGRVFGSVSTKEIAEAAKEQLGYELDKKKMHLKDAIKSTGTFHVPVKLHPKVTVELKVVVKEK